MRVLDILKILDKLAPFSLALDWDNSGLQVGDLESEVKKLAVCLDPTLKVMEEALKQGAKLLVSHHPLIFKPLKHISINDKSTEALIFALKNELTVVSAHTNYDASGMSQALADILELKVEGFLERAPLNYLKVVVFVPPESADALMEGIFQAGAGIIGNYSKCSFQLEGKGSFLGDALTNPAVGKSGNLEVTPELRVEAVLAPQLRDKVASAIIKNHPYEEPAYDFYEAQSPGKYGFGALGLWDPPREPLEFIAERLKLSALPTAGPIPPKVKRVALMPGSGGSYVTAAKNAGAELLVTGDLSHHQALTAADLGLGVISAGHFETENPGMLALSQSLKRILEPGVPVTFIAGEESIKIWTNYS
ncbi:MAG: Nif3-like dinuclear metal center hexameric protein [Deltaproteobacteria bacterium]|jgi:dinuclear metal center YbgI/SA1388 family protein|nr:Nif3-like dinuclear metal center hexameric protein [Deltaproteobacteria bacterium]